MFWFEFMVQSWKDVENFIIFKPTKLHFDFSTPLGCMVLKNPCEKSDHQTQPEDPNKGDKGSLRGRGHRIDPRGDFGRNTLVSHLDFQVNLIRSWGHLGMQLAAGGCLS